MRLRCSAILLAISLVLFVTASLLWFRSYRFEEAIAYRSGSHCRYSLGSQPGRICLEFIHEVHWGGTTASGPSGWWTYSFPCRDWQWEDYYTDDEYLLRRWGFAIITGERLTPDPSASPMVLGAVTLFPATAVSIPYWLAVLLTLALPLSAVRRLWLQRQRGRKGLCRGCGYDLRATPERCPECGRPIPTHA